MRLINKLLLSVLIVSTSLNATSINSSINKLLKYNIGNVLKYDSINCKDKKCYLTNLEYTHKNTKLKKQIYNSFNIDKIKIEKLLITWNGDFNKNNIFNNSIIKCKNVKITFYNSFYSDVKTIEGLYIKDIKIKSNDKFFIKAKIFAKNTNIFDIYNKQSLNNFLNFDNKDYIKEDTKKDIAMLKEEIYKNNNKIFNNNNKLNDIKITLNSSIDKKTFDNLYNIKTSINIKNNINININSILSTNYNVDTKLINYKPEVEKIPEDEMKYLKGSKLYDTYLSNKNYYPTSIINDNVKKIKDIQPKNIIDFISNLYLNKLSINTKIDTPIDNDKLNEYYKHEDNKYILSNNMSTYDNPVYSNFIFYKFLALSLIHKETSFYMKLKENKEKISIYPILLYANDSYNPDINENYKSIIKYK